MAIEQGQMQEYAKSWGQVVARTWGDEAFKQRLLAAPAPTLAEQGIALPPGLEVRVHENSPTVVHLTLPPRRGAPGPSGSRRACGPATPSRRNLTCSRR
jgi:hypothetical protein